MKKYIYPLAVTAAMLAAASCDDNEIIETPIPDSQKEMISFSLSAETGVSPSSITRAGFDGGNNGTQLSNPTQIVARISSSNSSSSVRHTKTLLTATYDQNANDNNEETRWNSYSTVDYATGDNNRRFWDDAFGRDAQISIYAVAVPNYTDVKNNSRNLYDLVKSGTTNVSTINTLWQTDNEESNNLNEIPWMVSITQTAGYNSTIENEDLCYSHNIQSDVDAAGDLNYGKGKNGVRVWGAHDSSDRDGNGYPIYKYSSSDSDKYPTLDDGTMKFRFETGATTEGVGHFDKGHMIFRHALARITVNLVKDDGFKDDETDFVLTSDNVILLNMHYNATLNFKTGKWSAYTEGTNIANANIKMASVTPSSGVQYSNFAQVIPGYTLGEGSNVNVMKFTVSDNTYYVTQKQLYAALNVSYNTGTVDVNGNKLVTVKDSKIALEQGKNYVFTIKVKKTGISSVTASLVPWVYVNGETTATNDYVKISIQDAQSTHCTHFDLYRMNDDMNDIYAPNSGPGTGKDWTANYNWYGDKGTESSQNYYEKATLSANGTNVWKTNWFWESNKSFYHFRTVNTNMIIRENTTEIADYFNIYGGPIKDYSDSETTISTAVDDGNVNDYHWGAPFKTGTIKYDEVYGFSASSPSDGLLYPAIGSTSQQINIIEHHMMSNVHVILKTTKDESKTNKLAEGSVDLTNAEVTLTNFCNSGKVVMGSGLIEPDPSSMTAEKQLTDPSTHFKTSGDNTETNAYSYRVVPQPLHRGTTASATDDTDLTNFIGLTIKTQDNNQYYVIKKLSEIKASEVKQNGSDYLGGNQTTGAAITRWYPGYDYTYIITISKKGIETITCTIVDWITVKGNDVNIDLES